MSDPRHQFVVEPGTKVDLSSIDPRDTGHLRDKDSARAQLEKDAAAIDELQERLFAERQHALLIILQGMDTSGKDGTVRAVFQATSPVGVTVTAFSRPTEAELAHDFLWRVHKACPPRGTIGIFNRSQYEDVLVGRVRKLAPAKVIEHRYNQINAFEDLIASSTKVLKFMLHISKEEQGERLRARLEEPQKHWKFDPGDLADRSMWSDYMQAYEQVLSRCSTEVAPWYVIPSDRKWARNAIVASIVRRTLEDMDPQYPEPRWDPRQFEVD
ncbi:MAG: polyphosphate kinase [Enterovirga sp.]|jgi:PPK2 family polyphosphate:nucleotide phosphotransferase|nr:polyphosphate kinase [Enterovirga sp.]